MAVSAADLIRNARYRAGLTQAQLAMRSGFPRPSIARWEAEAREPPLSTVSKLIAACGLELTLGLVAADHSLRGQADAQLEMTPGERLEALLPKRAAASAERALNVVAQLEAPAIVLGPIAGVLQGAPQRPGATEVEVVVTDMVAAATELSTREFTPTDDARRFRQIDQRWRWDGPRRTSLTLASAVPGGGDYAALRRNAVPVAITSGAVVRVAHPRDLLRLAEASSDESQQARASGLRALLA